MNCTEKKKSKRKWNFLNNKGFTLVELLLSLSVAGVIFGLTSEIMMQQADAYSFISSRKASVSDVRNAMHRISYELQRIGSGDILDISSSRIEFVDTDGEEASFRLDTDGSTLAIYRGSSDILISNIANFSIEYFNDAGYELDASDPEEIPDIRRIRVTITSEQQSGEGDMYLTSLIVPREFMGYTNYQ